MERPYATVVDVKELFGSESKSQVYAHLHNLLEKTSMDTTGECLFFFFVFFLLFIFHYRDIYTRPNY